MDSRLRGLSLFRDGECLQYVDTTGTYHDVSPSAVVPVTNVLADDVYATTSGSGIPRFDSFFQADRVIVLPTYPVIAVQAPSSTHSRRGIDGKDINRQC